MLYIIDIDDNTFGLSGTGQTVVAVEISFPKKYYAMSTNPVGTATGGLVSIKHDESRPALISSRNPDEITLDGTVYTDANDFVVAFNELMKGGTTVNAIVDFTDVTTKIQEVIDCVCRDCNDWDINSVESDTVTIAADTVNSCSIIFESGTVNVSNGTNNADLSTGQSITVDGSWGLNQDIVIDASAGKAIYITTSCAEVTTTTTVAATTTTEAATTTTESATTTTTSQQ